MLETDKGRLISQFFYGANGQIDASELEPQIKYLMNYALEIGHKPQKIILRHLHPGVEFFHIDKNMSQLQTYNQQDFSVTIPLSQKFPGIVFFDGAVSANGHTYQVRVLNGQQILPSQSKSP